MEFLSAVNLEQLGTSGLFIAFLIWQLSKKDDQLKSSEDERKEAQDKLFSTTRETQKEMFEATQIFERMHERLRAGQ